MDPTIQWLLDGDPAIRWQALRDLVGAPERAVEHERRKVVREGWGARLLAKQGPDGRWARGRSPDGGLYSPKWISTTYTLLTLRDFGLPPGHTSARMACRILLEEGLQRDGGVSYGTWASWTRQGETCISGMVLSLLSYFGLEDERLDTIARHLLDEQMPDGGWNCRRPSGATHASVHTTLSVLEGLRHYELHRGRLLAAVRRAQRRGREFLLAHRLFRSHRTGAVIKPAFTLFSFPPRWYYDVLRALDHFQAVEAPRDRRLADGIDVVRRHQKEDGRWPLQNRHPGKVYFEMERVGSPSRWNTLRALRVLKWWGEECRATEPDSRIRPVGGSPREASMHGTRTFGALALSLAFIPGAGAQGLVNPATEKKIDALIAQMTLEEKVGQLNQYSSAFDVTGPPPSAGHQKAVYDQIRAGLVGSLLNVTGAEATRKAQQMVVEGTRLKIPLIFGLDVIHGYRTMFPTPLGETASWDIAAIEQSARIGATEAAAAGIHWTFAPMMDIARDARWGRIMEGAGEDPYLGAQAAAARVRGFQGKDLAALDTIAACAKHYAAYGFAEAGRDYNTVDISEQTLRNVVLPPFKAAADAGVATFMNSFNEIAGIPSTGSVHLQRDILKGEWAFQGFVVSDWGSIGEMIPHGFSENLEHAAQQAITAGSDMDMEARAYVGHLAALVNAGKVDVKLVDDAVRRVLRVKFALGLFDDPYRYSDAAREKQVLASPAHAAASRDVARKSIVLLKNEGGLLPLDKGAKTIAVVGPWAADKDAPLGNWRAQAVANSAVSVLEGIQAAVPPTTRVVHAEGVKLVTGARNFMAPSVINTTDRSGLPAAVEAARSADVVVAVVGEDAFQSGEGRSQADIGLKGLQEELLKSVFAANKKVVVVLMTGRPITLGWTAENAPAIVEAWHGGSQAGHAIADVLFGDYNPSGKLPVGFPRVVGQLPMTYAHKNTGRPGPEPGVTWSAYTDVPNDPLYPFGFGLSYTTFTYSEPKLSAAEIGRDGSLQVAVTVTNTGQRPGVEVAQLYVRDLVGSVTRPVKELKGFQKVDVQPGQSREVTFTLKASDLAFYTAAGNWEVEPGAFKVFVGGNSRDVKEAGFRLK